MKKVAMIGPELYPIPPIRGGAAELWIEETVHVLQDWRPFVFSPADAHLPKEETDRGVRYLRIRVNPVKKAMKGWLKIYSADYEKKIAPLLEEADPEIIHVHNRPLLVSFFKERFKKKKIILHMHNLYDYLGRREKPHGEFEIPSDLFVGCSRFVVQGERERLARGSGGQAVIYNGVDTERFRPRWMHPAETEEARRRLGLVEKSVVLYAGKIRESKGVGVLWRAMKEVFRQDPSAVLLLAGGTGFGMRAERKTEFSRELGREMESFGKRVLRLGFVPPREMPGVYLLGDVFTAPSQLEEGLGMVFLEASSTGLPIVSTRQGGIPEVVLDGQTGLLLAEKDNAAELAEKILLLLRNPARRMELGREGRERVVQHFSWPKIGRATEEIYSRLTR